MVKDSSRYRQRRCGKELRLARGRGGLSGVYLLCLLYGDYRTQMCGSWDFPSIYFIFTAPHSTKMFFFSLLYIYIFFSFIFNVRLVKHSTSLKLWASLIVDYAGEISRRCMSRRHCGSSRRSNCCVRTVSHTSSSFFCTAQQNMHVIYCMYDSSVNEQFWGHIISASTSPPLSSHFCMCVGALWILWLSIVAVCLVLHLAPWVYPPSSPCRVIFFFLLPPIPALASVY